MAATAINNKTLGILGGGQLGKMLCTPINNMHIKTSILDPTPNCPASVSCNDVRQGSFTDFDTVYNFGKEVDVLTIEIENVNTDALLKLQAEGKTVHPNPKALSIIKDKGLQKEFYDQHQLPTSAYTLYSNKQEVLEEIEKGNITYPFVQKARTEGYDGKGVAVINSAEDNVLLLDTACVIEDKVALKKELAVIAARDEAGNIVCFDPVEMLFDPKANLVTSLMCPADISDTVAQKATEMAKACIAAYDIVGLLAVEFFLDENDNLLINEVAPRPHNSGHHTIENCVTSQYEQHIRAVMGLPLGNTQTIIPAVMINLLGEAGYTGKAVYEGLSECMQVAGAKFHIYGKENTKPFRKMGHVTVLDDTAQGALNKANHIQKTLRIIA